LEGGYDRINVQNNPVNFVDPFGLDALGRIAIGASSSMASSAKTGSNLATGAAIGAGLAFLGVEAITAAVVADVL
jgi:hypothetical protein